ncbi:helix-turn-helix domain-containing protein [Streptomyces rishiriensis]|uniref:Transcriptional regulator with XRE-family HTH domain n=1 Tax=Streptomyces rishiriensis TaxID=68264 RepID=A0ABU0NG38_STRRH|nr:helix-turn-helix transcriptional regulator [Streptomyces rishiriensis]MDQ0578076.1 transcriptional regulator with XRE-family HTH domain [Streptomyces rishiriensis]
MTAAELGQFLTARRHQTNPASLGLPAGARRRVTGLRRAEVAHLADISVDYYTRIEQGRSGSPTPAVLDALAQAMSLGTQERMFLFNLAGHMAPARHTPVSIHPAVDDLLHRLHHTPAMILSDLHEVLARNELAEELLGELPAGTGSACTLSYRWFTDPAARARVIDEDRDYYARTYVADLRRAAATRRGDPAVADLVARLRNASPCFARLWQAHEISVPARPVRLMHPDAGVVGVVFRHFTVTGAGQRLVWITAAHDQTQPPLPPRSVTAARRSAAPAFA